MEKLVMTYGKTIHTWHTDQERTVPSGIPMIMMGFTRDGQLDPKLLKARDDRFGVSSTARRENRLDLPSPKPDSLADSWQHGLVRQLTLTSAPDSARDKAGVHAH